MYVWFFDLYSNRGLSFLVGMVFWNYIHSRPSSFVALVMALTLRYKLKDYTRRKEWNSDDFIRNMQKIVHLLTWTRKTKRFKFSKLIDWVCLTKTFATMKNVKSYIFYGISAFGIGNRKKMYNSVYWKYVVCRQVPLESRTLELHARKHTQTNKSHAHGIPNTFSSACKYYEVAYVWIFSAGSVCCQDSMINFYRIFMFG